MWIPQRGPQLAAIEAAWCDELFYGGQRGGGKSDFQLGYQQDNVLQYQGKSRGIMFRKTYPELEELQSRASEIFPTTGGIFKSQPSAQYPFSNSWYWSNGATVKMRYIEREQDYGRYHGHQYTTLSFDEVTEYISPFGLMKMLSTLRSPYGVPCTVRLTGNPGGVGHTWVKSRYIDITPPMTPYTDAETGFTRMFVPSALSDNQILLENDPKYRNRLLASTGGNEALRKAWLDGDWNIVAGAFFDCWSNEKHVLKPFNIPDDWTRFRSGDWGSARPFSFGWWAIVRDDFIMSDGRILPRGALVRYREFYGARDSVNLPNIGLKMHAEDVGSKIAQLERGDKISYGVLDPAAFAEDGGPSIAERIYNGSDKRVSFRRADNKRVPRGKAPGGWDQMRSRFIGENEKPMAYCFSTCLDSIRTIPLLQHDDTNIEDINTDMEDHAADEWRYACMSRPYSRAFDVELEKPRFLHELTADEVFFPKHIHNNGIERI